MLNRLLLVACALAALECQPAQCFDGTPWNVSTGNLSVQFIQHSPIGAAPVPGFLEPPPSVESLRKMKAEGLVAYEDYVAWGAVERAPGQWDWTEHDRMCDAVHAAGLHYVVYDWVHFPPVWLRNSSDATLMRCLEHQQDTNYLSIFDPRTINHYDHFYRALAQHFGNRIDGVYACILGPYGEGNYPLNVPDFVNMGHCHEGYWCADPYAIASFQNAMKRKYGDTKALNLAWGTRASTFSEVRPPEEIKDGFKPTPAAWHTAQDRHRWLDFITWYHQAIIDFAENSLRVVLRYFPREKVRMKPGGNAGGVNPIAWGTYCPGYAKMAGPYGVTLQPADCQGAYFGDKWLATAYQFYGVRLATEPAGGLDQAGFVRRMFSDASCGAAQMFTYEFEQHVPEIQRYAHLLTGHPGETQIAVLCPTTLYRLGGDLSPTIRAATRLRDMADYDVLDELLIADGALTKRYRVLIMLEPQWIEQGILDRVQRWVRRGGTLVVVGGRPINNVEGQAWHMAGGASSAAVQVLRAGNGRVLRISDFDNGTKWIKALQPWLASLRGTDGRLDGVWTTGRGAQRLMFNTTAKPVQCYVGAAGTTGAVEIAPHTILEAVEPTARAHG